MNASLKKKLVIITSRFPYPLEKGDKLRIYHQIRELSYTFEIHLLSISDIPVSPDYENELLKYCESVQIYRISLVSRIVGMLRSLFFSLPIQVGYFFNPFHKQRIIRTITALQPDAIYCQLIRVTEYVKEYHDCPKVLDYMDAFSKGMERRRHLGKWYATFFFEMESRRLRRYEQRIFDYFEEKLIISEQDKNFIAHPNRSKIVAVPNGIDRSFFEDLPITPTYDLVFVGNLSYAPNIEAVLYLKDSILPLVKDCSLLVSGAQPSKSLQIACDEATNITLQGWVNDIRESYKSGAVFVAPMMIGTGMQNKLLEAMALGIPCITTSLANNAIGAVNGETILVAETAEQFKDAINLLRADSALYHRISTQAKQFVQDHFQWNQSTRIIQGLIDKLTDR